MVKWKLVTILLSSLLFFAYLTRHQWKQPAVPFTSNAPLDSQTTLVFIHIQKTAGSEFERSIVRRLRFGSRASCRCPVVSRHPLSKRPVVKLRCNCSREIEPWLISRFSVGWLCGVHADWTTYHRCLPSKMNFDYGFNQRKFMYATLLREPVARFISEYLHTIRGATWLPERLPCSKAQQLRNQYACWNRTNLVDFIQCPFNSATNRQSRMLTSSFTRCSSPSFAYSNLIDLNSAKENLQSMEFFGLTEYLPLSQRLFERTSYCRSSAVCSFQSYLEQDWSNNQTFDYIRTNISSADADRLRQMNSDDIELYRFARDLFFQRTCQTLGVACQPAL